MVDRMPIEWKRRVAGCRRGSIFEHAGSATRLTFRIVDILPRWWDRGRLCRSVPVPASHNVHPEFGLLCPTPRFRRRLRLVLAGLVVAGLGAGVMAATGGSKPETAANRVDAAYLAGTVLSREHTAVLRNRRVANSRGCRWVWVDRRGEASLRRRHPVRAHLSRGQAAQAAHGPGGHRSPSHRCRGYRPQRRSRHGHDRCGAFRRRRIRRNGEGERSRGRGRECHRIREVRYHAPRSRRRRRAGRTVAATRTGMALRPGARSSIKGAGMVAEATGPISGEPSGRNAVVNRGRSEMRRLPTSSRHQTRPRGSGSGWLEAPYDGLGMPARSRIIISRRPTKTAAVRQPKYGQLGTEGKMAELVVLALAERCTRRSNSRERRATAPNVRRATAATSPCQHS